MWPFLGKGICTHYFDGTLNILDQFMISKGILNGKSGFQVKKTAEGMYAVKIESFSEMVAEGEYPRPKRFGRPYNNSLNEDGYSDYFPMSMILEEIII